MWRGAPRTPAMNGIVERVEEGAYVVKERSGLRTLTIPRRHKPGALDVELLANKATAARKFLEETSTCAPDFDFQVRRPKANRSGAPGL